MDTDDILRGYRRPRLPQRVYRDAVGMPVRYGERWSPGSPPEDAYSRTSNLDRFVGLWDVADALITWLVGTFHATADDDLAHVGAFLPGGVPNGAVHDVRAVRVAPPVPGAASLTFAYSSFPGVTVHAGAAEERVFPACGCDACDETAAGGADEMEWMVAAVVSGGFGEEFAGPAGARTIGSWLATDDRSQGGGDGLRLAEISEPHRTRIVDAMAARPARGPHEGWVPWWPRGPHA